MPSDTYLLKNGTFVKVSVLRPSSKHEFCHFIL